MPLVDFDQLKARVAADNQKRSPSDLAVDPVSLQAALLAGERAIFRTLQSRGYTLAEVLAGDDLYEMHLSQSLYHAYFFGGVPQERYDLRQVEGFDRVAEMKDPKFGWLIGGVVVWPSANRPTDAAGTCGTGLLADFADVPGVPTRTTDFRRAIRNDFKTW